MRSPLRKARDVTLKGGGSIMAQFKFHWWELELECGHVVERRIRWRKIDNPPRGFAAQHHSPSLTRLPDRPRGARCEFCPEEDG